MCPRQGVSCGLNAGDKAGCDSGVTGREFPENLAFGLREGTAGSRESSRHRTFPSAPSGPVPPPVDHPLWGISPVAQLPSMLALGALALFIPIPEACTVGGSMHLRQVGTGHLGHCSSARGIRGVGLGARIPTSGGRAGGWGIEGFSGSKGCSQTDLLGQNWRKPACPLLGH